MGSNSIKLVNEAAEFVENEQSFQHFLSYNNISLKEPYYFVAIMGGQSGGKSTLMNALFGTSLAVLPQGERHATTKGIDLALSTKNANRTLVLDLEGSDSIEKSESAGETFARKSSLFALAVSEVLIVNVWAQDIGKRSATNLPVLKSIFEAIFRIDCASQTRTKLLFILRDYNAEIHCPLPVLTEIVNKCLADIWASLERPQRFAQASFDCLFALTFHTLPHKIYEPSAFDNAVDELSSRFGPFGDLVNTPGCVGAKMRYVEPRALYGYLRVIWTSISTMRELEIVSQKELLTAHICEEAFEDCCAEFLAKSAVFGRAYEDWGAFGFEAETLFGEILLAFNEKASPRGWNEEETNYNKDANEYEEDKNFVAIKAIQTKWRLKLKEFLRKELKIAQNEGKRLYERNALKEHKAALSSALVDTDYVVENFDMIIRKKGKRVINTLEENYKKLDLSFCRITIYGDRENRPGDELSAGLEENTREFIDKVKNVLLTLILKNTEEALKSFECIYNTGGKGVWETLSQNSKALVNKLAGRTESFAKRAGKSADWRRTFKNSVFAQMEKMANTTFACLAQLSDQRLMGEFDALFKVETKRIHMWEKMPDYKPAWLSAKNECLDRLRKYTSKPKPLFAVRSISRTTRLVNAAALTRMRKSFEKYTEAALNKANEFQGYTLGSELLTYSFTFLMLAGGVILK